MTPRPRTVRLRTYAVRSGNCLLVTVGYGSPLPDGRRTRHVLVDCGTTEPTRRRPSLADVAGAVAEHCEGRLDVVVATRPHTEHRAGFDDPAVVQILRPLSPAVVVRPWTDAPGTDPPLPAMLASAARTGAPGSALLDEWGRDGRTAYVRAGDTAVLDGELPGVTVEVLGPPGAEQLPAMVRPAQDIFALDAEGMLPSPVAPASDVWVDALTTLADPGGAGAAERLVRRLRERRVSHQMGVDTVADVARNTSVMLLLTVGNRTLVLPGDTQTAGWAPVLDRVLGTKDVAPDAGLARRLAAVDIYAVGQHGARRATPVRLRTLWHRRPRSARPLVSVLDADKRADAALVADLESLGPVHRIDSLPDGMWWLDVESPVTGRAPVTVTHGP
jgi:hypothetical protein